MPNEKQKELIDLIKKAYNVHNPNNQMSIFDVEEEDES